MAWTGLLKGFLIAPAEGFSHWSILFLRFEEEKISHTGDTFLMCENRSTHTLKSPTGQKKTETDRNYQKRTKTSRNRKKKNRNGQKQIEPDRNG